MLAKLDYPPIWLVLFMALAWLVSEVHNPLGSRLFWPGLALILAGVAVAVWAALEFRRARTTIVPREDPSALVETGPFRWSRNPIYLADLAILAGWCLMLGTAASLLFLVPFQQILLRRFILPEEAVLTAHLGAAYDDYRRRVRRWW